MYKLNIKESLKSPKVIFDPERFIFEMEGNSRPENVRDFYYPIVDTLKDFFNEIINKNEVEKYICDHFDFNFKLEYFNSASAKFIADILVLVEKYNREGFNFKVNWYFEDGDEDMKDVGEDFSEMVEFPFNFIMIKK